jgi:hypothetical protein
VDGEGARSKGLDGGEGQLAEGEVVAEVEAEADPLGIEGFEEAELLGSGLVFVVLEGELQAVLAEDGLGPAELGGGCLLGFPEGGEGGEVFVTAAGKEDGAGNGGAGGEGGLDGFREGGVVLLLRRGDDSFQRQAGLSCAAAEAAGFVGGQGREVSLDTGGSEALRQGEDLGWRRPSGGGGWCGADGLAEVVAEGVGDDAEAGGALRGRASGRRPGGQQTGKHWSVGHEPI